MAVFRFRVQGAGFYSLEFMVYGYTGIEDRTFPEPELTPEVGTRINDTPISGCKL